MNSVPSVICSENLKELVLLGRGLAKRVFDVVYLSMSIGRVPSATGRLMADAAPLYLDYQEPKSGNQEDKISFSVMSPT